MERRKIYILTGLGVAFLLLLGLHLGQRHLESRFSLIHGLVSTNLLEALVVASDIRGELAYVRTQLETYQQTGTPSDAQHLVHTTQGVLHKIRAFICEAYCNDLIKELKDKSRSLEGDVHAAISGGPRGNHAALERKLEGLYLLSSTLYRSLTDEREHALKRQSQNLSILSYEVAFAFFLSMILFTLLGLWGMSQLMRQMKTQENLEELQEKSKFQERMAFLGGLTASIAHELKNPLNFVKNFAEVSKELLDDLKKEHESDLVAILQSNNDKIVHHTQRATDIITNMQQHARTPSEVPEKVDLNTLVHGAVKLAVDGLKSKNSSFNVDIETKLDQGCGEIEAYPQDLSRVILNLVDNACYAAEKAQRPDGAKVKVETRKLDGAYEVRIWDNGTGIPGDKLAKIFEPFFTTKPTGEGTGLGLSISYDIVTKQHKGSLTAASEQGEFTEFVVSLPA